MEYLRLHRIYKVFLIFTVLFLLNIIRLYFIQLPGHENYVNKMQEQDTYNVSLEEYQRGQILDRNLIPLTNTETKDRIIVFPPLVLDRINTINTLAGILNISTAKISREINKFPHYMKIDITPQQAEAVKRANLAGIKVTPVTFRYNIKTLASHTLGYISDSKAKDGLELYYDKELKGIRPERTIRAYVDGNGSLIPGLGYKVEQQQDTTRHDLVLTLDNKAQKIVETYMDTRMLKGTIVVMDAKSGELLALASKPAKYYDPSTKLYLPGSVFKIVVAAAALEEGIVTPDTQFFCKGEKDKPIRCWSDPGHGQLNFASAMAESCNPTFAKVGIMVGANKLIEYADKMGLGNQSIIGYPFAPDKMQDLEEIKETGNLVNSSVGQWPVFANPVQITAMTAVIANKGIYREPRLVQQIRDVKGQVTKTFSKGKAKQIISANTAKLINDMLVKVVTEGTGKNAMVAPSSAGKTGSAEVDIKKGTKNVWFTGYAPADQPKYVVTVLMPDLNNPGDSGGKTAAPVFKDIMEELLKL